MIDERGIALFFFAGHGLQVRGENYLMPIDADIEEEFEVSDECVSLDRILRAMDASKSHLNLVFLDSCRNNPYKRGWSRSAEVGLAQTAVPEGTLISFAAAPGKEALDGAGRNSPFTEALLSTLSRPGVPLTDALMSARKQVYEKTNRKQRPWVSHDLLEKVVLRENSKSGGSELSQLKAQITSMEAMIKTLQSQALQVETGQNQTIGTKAAKNKDEPLVDLSGTGGNVREFLSTQKDKLKELESRPQYKLLDEASKSNVFEAWSRVVLLEAKRDLEGEGVSQIEDWLDQEKGRFRK